MKGQYFAVINLKGNSRLLYGLGILALLVFLMFLIVSFTNVLISDSRDFEQLPYKEVLKEQWYGEYSSDSKYPRFFIAGGHNYDQNILAQHGIDNLELASVNHFNDIGVYVVGAGISRIDYFAEEREVFIEVKNDEPNYQLVTLDKFLLGEGPITYIFVDKSKGDILNSEEDYIYSTPVQFTLLEEGKDDIKVDGLEKFVVADSNTVPILAENDMYSNDLHSDDQLCMYVFGGEVVTIQQRENLTRVYFNESEGYQIFSVKKEYFQEGENVIKFIRESDLREFDQHSLILE
ncbi:hypothetical protein PRVXT_001277 [Proteinivorax tanatarense]|uniref:Uncharacterized protein n=1 Tax=Proteinivorax tanatarense TaxID=1260629 RepID=A0AAU7VPX2_9FIRM